MIGPRPPGHKPPQPEDPEGFRAASMDVQRILESRHQARQEARRAGRRRIKTKYMGKAIGPYVIDPGTIPTVVTNLMGEFTENLIPGTVGEIFHGIACVTSLLWGSSVEQELQDVIEYEED